MNWKDNQKTFKSPIEMLATIQDAVDLYNPNTGEYVFLYNEAGSIAVYILSEEEAADLERQARASHEYWGAFLGIGGSIYDDPSHEHYSPDLQSNLEWCENAYREEGWIDVSPKKLNNLTNTMQKEEISEERER